MPSKTSGTAGRREGGNSFADDYLADWGDDPFRSPSPEPARKNDKEQGEKKDVLGIDKELDLKRKPRAPRVKLDEARLLSDKGIPKLRKMAPKLKFKGKGHEFSDAARLLSFYQEWLDDLFPKATFLDALAMVEKLGHKTAVRNARLQWIDECKPRSAEEEERDSAVRRSSAAPRQPDRVAPIFETNAAKAAQERAKTPAVEDLFGDEDIYNATPRRTTDTTAPSGQPAQDDVPGLDDLDALMAEAEADTGRKTQQPMEAGPASGPRRSIFGNGSRSLAASTAEPDDDDLDALMAEADAQTPSGLKQPSEPAARASIFGDGKPTERPSPAAGAVNEDDLDALVAEADLIAHASSPTGGKQAPLMPDAQPVETAKVSRGDDNDDDDDDDLDALMAEVEAGAAGQSTGGNDSKSAPPHGVPTASFDADEEAMAELDGLW